MSKVKDAVSDGVGSVSNGLSQLDPTTKDGQLNIATFGTYGAVKEAGERFGNEPDTPGETESEKVAGEVAIKEYDFARKLDFVKDEYAKRVERLGSDEMQSSVTGRANRDAQNQVDTFKENAASGLESVGVDPSSGRHAITMGKASEAAGEAVGAAQAESEFALDSAAAEGRNNRIAMAMGEKTKAVAGLQDIAQGANSLAAAKAKSKFNSDAVENQAIGTAAGLATVAYANRDDE